MKMSRVSRVIVCLLAAVTVSLQLPVAILGLTDGGGGGGGLVLRELSVDADIVGSLAITEIRATLDNPTDVPLNRSFFMRVPERALISNFSITLRGETLYADVVEAKEAKERYDEAVREGRASGLVASQRAMSFSYSLSVPAGESISAALRFEEVLLRANGGYRYDLFLTGDPSPIPASAFVVSITVNARERIDRLDTTGYDGKLVAAVAPPALATVGLQELNVVPAEDISVAWTTQDGPKGGRMYFYEEGGEGYFLHTLDPSPDDVGGQLARDVVIIMDRSGSMSGRKIEQAKEGVSSLIKGLTSEDKMDIVAFDNGIEEYGSGLRTADGDARSAACAWVDDIESGGSTDIHSAVMRALERIGQARSEVPIIVLLTDGQANTGLYARSEFRQDVLAKNTVDAVINTIAIGSDADWTFLEALALENNGRAMRTLEGDDVGKLLEAFLGSISRPVLSDIELRYGPGVTDVHPSTVRGHYAGSEVLVTGRYTPGASMVITSEVKATGAGGLVQLPGTFPVTPDPANGFVARYYAYSRIQSLQDRIKWNGTDNATVSEIVALGIRYHFVTDYTSLFVEAPVLQDEEYLVAPRDMPTLGAPAPSASMAEKGAPAFDAGWTALALVFGSSFALLLHRRRRRQ